MNTDTGGPAFPAQNHHGQKFTGMTLRDYFAAKALQAYLTAPDTGWDFNELSRAAYEQADAMLEARGEK
jgi:hypothetical protein